MATHDYVIANGTGAAVRSDLNNALAAIVSNNSGTSEPATTYAYQWWADTTNNLLKIRNSANNAWITLRELDGTLLMEEGSVSAPSLAFAVDLDTGLFRSAANKLNIATAGAERLEIGSSEVVFNDPSNDVDFRVESNGNTHMLFVEGGTDRVGIGESDPDQTLHISEAASGTTMGVLIHNTATADDSDARLTFNTNSGGAEKTRGYIQATGNTSGVGNLIFATRKSGTTSESARIDSSGRLMLGTTTTRAGGIGIAKGFSSSGVPAAGTSTSSLLVGNDDGGSYGLAMGANGSGNGYIQAQRSDGSTTIYDLYIQPNGGNLGVGTTSITEFVDIRKDQNAFTWAQIQNQDSSSGSYAGIQLGANGNTWGLANGSSATNSNSLTFVIDAGGSNSEKMRLTTGGNLMIGTSTAGAGAGFGTQLAVAGGDAAMIKSTGQGASSVFPLRVWHDATSGDNLMVQFATESSLTTRGSIRYLRSSNVIQYATTSDARLKTNINDSPSALGDLSEIRVRSFDWVEEGHASVEFGFIAQEVNEVVPLAVSVGDSGDEVSKEWGVDNSKIVPLLTKALQEAIAKIEILETKVAALEAG